MREEIDLGIQKKMKSKSAVPGVSAVENLNHGRSNVAAKQTC